MINTITNVDCLQGIANVKKNSIKTIIADPPYFMGMTHNGQKGSFVDLAICRPFYEKLFMEFDRVLTADGSVFFFCDYRSYAFYYQVMESFLPVRNMLVWNKLSGPGNFYSFSHELIIFVTKNNQFKGNGTNIWSTPSFASGAKATNGEKVHPTQKPLELIKRIISDSTSEGDTILDPFIGSGTTAVAAREMNRNVIGFELDPKNFEIMKKRLYNLKNIQKQITL